MPQGQPRAQAGGADLRGRALPADRVADRLPDAVRQGRRATRADRADPGRGRRRRQRRDRARPPRRPARVGHQPRRGARRPRQGARRARRVRERRAAARARRRRARDRRRGDLEALAARAAARRHDRRLGFDERAEPTGRPAAGVLPPAQRRRLDDGHARRARPPRPAARDHRDPPGDRPRPPARRRPRRVLGDGRPATSSARSSSRHDPVRHHLLRHLGVRPRLRRRGRLRRDVRRGAHVPGGHEDWASSTCRTCTGCSSPSTSGWRRRRWP